MAPCFENIYATEMSYTMQWRLQQKGFKWESRQQKL
jgi:hypothetical protein